MSIISRIAHILDHSRSVWMIFAVALFVRGVMLVALHDSSYTSGMAQGELARNIVEGRGFVIHSPFSDSLGALQSREDRLVDIEEGLENFQPDTNAYNFRPFIAYMMPGQGILLSGMYALTGSYSYVPLQIVQVIVDSCIVFLIVATGSLLFSRQAGLLAAIAFAVYIPEARLIVSATRDAWMPILYAGTAYASARLWRQPGAVNALILGTVTAVAVYFRSEIILLPAWIAMLSLATGSSVKIALKRLAIAMVPVLLLLTPWTARNFLIFDRLIPTNTGMWVAMWECFGEYPNEFGAVHNDVVTLEQMRKEGHAEAFDAPEYDDLFRPKVLGVLRDHPMWVAWTVLRRIARIPFQMHAWGISATDDIHSAAPPYAVGSAEIGPYFSYLLDHPSRLFAHLMARGVNLALYLGVMLWFWKNRRGRWKEGLVLLAIPSYNILIHSVTCTHARYILPTNALLLLFIAALLIDRFGVRFSKFSSRV